MTQILGQPCEFQVNAQANASRRFYVSTTGDDTGAGTASDPFATIQGGVDHAGPGDTVVVRDGVYGCEPGGKPGQCSAVRSPLAGFPVVLSTRGTADAPITLMAEHAGKAVLDCDQKCHSFILLQVSKTPSWPRSWANCSLF